MMRMLASALLVFGLFSSTLVFAGVNIVSVGSKTYRVKFEEPELKSCPIKSEMYSAFIFLYQSAYGAGYNASLGKCHANCTREVSENCEEFCKTPERVVEHKALGIKQTLILLREYPPSYRHESCKRVRDYCADKCAESGVMNEAQCRVDCEHYETYNKNS